jgi:ornithine cyclodeaminase
MKIINKENVREGLSWSDVIQALTKGHQKERALLRDSLIEQENSSMLSRSAWVKGLGYGVKSVTITPANSQIGLPTVQGSMLIFNHDTGQAEVLIDSELITYWKTAADSVLGATLLARPTSQSLLIVGAGVVAESLVRAYTSAFSNLNDIKIYNHKPDKAKKLAKKLHSLGYPCSLSTSLFDDSANADIIACATMSQEPIVFGDHVSAGTHVDLIGAFKPNMREADDVLLQKSRLFVDCVDTTIDHIGELMIPISNEAIKRTDVLGDLYDLINMRIEGRLTPDDITVFKNGGGAHLDLMTARAIIFP